MDWRETAAAAATSNAAHRRECPWPFVVLPPDVARDTVVALLDDAERYCRRAAGYTATDCDGDDGVEDARGSDDDSEEDDLVQRSAVGLSKRMREAYYAVAHGEDMPRGVALGLTEVMAQQSLLSHNDPFQGCAPDAATLSQPLGEGLLAACLAHGPADVATSAGVTSRMVSPRSNAECFVCHEEISGLETLITLPFGQCAECERYRCRRCVQAVPRPGDMRCSECAVVLDGMYDDGNGNDDGNGA